MESTEVAEAKVAIANQKATSMEMLACETEERALEVELAFQRQKRHIDAMMDDAKHSTKKIGGGRMTCVDMQVND